MKTLGITTATLGALACPSLSTARMHSNPATVVLGISSYVALSSPGPITITLTPAQIAAQSGGPYTSSAPFTFGVSSNTGGTFSINVTPSQSVFGVVGGSVDWIWAAVPASGTFPIGTSTGHSTLTISNIDISDLFNGTSATYTFVGLVTITVTNSH